jgi:hypothetical protein
MARVGVPVEYPAAFSHTERWKAREPATLLSRLEVGLRRLQIFRKEEIWMEKERKAQTGIATSQMVS